MSNLAAVLKAEISRVARKEVRAELTSLKNLSVAHRAAIAQLRRQIVVLEKELRNSTKPTGSIAQADEANSAEADGPKRRFSAAKLVANRKKLGLSAVDFGKIIGVSGQTIYQWEQGKVRPRSAQLEKLAMARTLSPREIADKLSANS